MLYKDRYISCDAEGIHIRGYYFPWGTKHVAYSEIRAISAFPLTKFRGGLRIWGSSSFTTWANLDPGRPGKDRGLLLDVGKPVRIFVTPDDADAVARLLSERSGLPVQDRPEGPLV